MPHSNQVREFLLTSRGIELANVYLGAEGVLTGSARLAQEAREKEAALQKEQEVEARQRALERKRQALEAHILALRKEFEAEAEELQRRLGEDRARTESKAMERVRMGISRKSDDGLGLPRSAPRPRKPQQEHHA